MIAQQIEQLLARFDSRGRTILASRLLIQPKQSLEEIGERLNLTRERVRQLERDIKIDVKNWLDKSREIQAFCDQVVDVTGYLASYSTVIDALPEAAEEILISIAPDIAIKLPTWKVIQSLNDSFECDGEWFYVPSIEKVEQGFDKNFEDESVEKRFIPADQVLGAFEVWGSVTPEELVSWAELRGYRRIRDALVAPHVRSMQDLAEVALELQGSPLTTEELHEAVASSRSIRSLAIQLATHERLQRVGAESWGLVEWGHERFSSIRESILSRVDRDGSVNLVELIGELTDKFGVAESSIRLYAAAWPLKTEKGVVSRQEEQTTPAGRPFARSRGCFVTSKGLAYRSRATSEHLRGSGSQFPTALAVALGNSIGQSLLFESADTLKTLRLSWNGNQATISTIRSELEAVQIQEGDDFAIFFEPSKAKFVKLASAIEDPFENLGRLCLIPSAERVTRISVARSLGLEESAVWDEILQSVVARKESDLEDAVRRVIDQLLKPA